MPRKSDLGLGFSPPFQDSWVQDQPAASRSRVIASCLMAARAINSDWLKPRWRSLRACNGTGTTITGRSGPAGIEPAQCFRQHAAQDHGSRPHLFIFQQVNQFAQPAVVAAIGHRSGKGRLHSSAQTTASFAQRRHRPHTDSATALRTLEQTPPAMGRISERQGGQTGRREMFIRGATAKTTIGGEESSEETFCNTAQRRDQH